MIRYACGPSAPELCAQQSCVGHVLLLGETQFYDFPVDGLCRGRGPILLALPATPPPGALECGLFVALPPLVGACQVLGIFTRET